MNMHKNIGKKCSVSLYGKKIVIEIIAVSGDLYVCRSEQGNMCRFKAEEVEIL